MRLTISRDAPMRPGQLQLRGFFADDELAVFFAREFEQGVREAAMDIHQGEALDVISQGTHPRDQFLHEVKCKRRVGGDETLEVSLRDDGQARRVNGNDGRRARAAVERHLAEIFARAGFAEHDFAATGVSQKNFHAAFEHNIERVGGVAFGDHHAVFRITAADRMRGNGAQLAWA